MDYEAARKKMIGRYTWYKTRISPQRNKKDNGGIATRGFDSNKKMNTIYCRIIVIGGLSIYSAGYETIQHYILKYKSLRGTIW